MENQDTVEVFQSSGIRTVQGDQISILSSNNVLSHASKYFTSINSCLLINACSKLRDTGEHRQEFENITHNM